MTARFEFGLALPPLPDAATFAATLAYADTAGFSTLWAPDRTLSEAPFLDCLSTVAAMALATKHVRIGPVSLIAARRNPILTAHALASIDYLSGGRLVVGAGVSGVEPREFDIVGVDIATRGARTDEYLHLWRRLFNEESVDHAGVHASVENITILPRPAAHVPLWIAGSSAAAQVRAARVGDAWIPTLLAPDDYRAGWAHVVQSAENLGRDPGDITPAVYLFGSIASDEAFARTVLDGALRTIIGAPLSAVESACLVGTPAQWVEQIQRWRAIGVEHVSTVLMSADDAADIRLLGDEVLPALGIEAHV